MDFLWKLIFYTCRMRSQPTNSRWRQTIQAESLSCKKNEIGAVHSTIYLSNRCELELSFVVRVSTARALFRVLDSITTNQHRFRNRTNVIWPGACAKWTFVAPAKRKNKCPRTKRGGNNRGPILHRTFVYLGRDAFSEATHLFPGWMPTRTDINST